MNVWGKHERSWRRKNKRAVSPIIATILLVAITVVLAAVLYILIQQYTKNGSNGSPLGTAFAFGRSTDATSSTGPSQNNYYNMTIEQASSTLTFGMLLFELKAPGGSVFATTIAVGVVNPRGVVEAEYCLGTQTPVSTLPTACTGQGTWVYEGAHCGAPAYTSTCSSTSVITSSSFLSLVDDTATGSLAGYTLYALGQGAYSGSVSGPIT
jgi:flagellin-like protein